MITLRPYQMEALAAIEAALQKDKYVLLQAATGAGKTIMFSELIKKYMTAYQMRIGVLAHRQELVIQAYDKLLKVWPEAYFKVGKACAALGRVENQRPVVIGSIQTMARQIKNKPFNLLIIDEAHRIPALNKDSQYINFIKACEKLYPDLRILGVTATPYRLGHGYIFGGQKRADKENLFKDLAYQISLNDLIRDGFLVPIRAKEAVDIAGALAKLKVTAGDYNQGELNNVMTKEVHVNSAVKAYEQYGENRQSVVVFAVSIEHAELLAGVFSKNGHPAAAVHSEMPDDLRRKNLKKFEEGYLKILVNVGVLTEGWDSPKVDLIMLCRPTKAPALFVQMVGRGTRLYPGKKDLLVLDLSGNFKQHGDPANPTVTWGQGGGQAEAPLKACPACAEFVHAAKMVCPVCTYNWPPPEFVEPEELQLREINFTPPPQGLARVLHWQLETYLSQRGHYLLSLNLKCRPGGLVTHYLDLEGRTGFYAKMKARALWWQLAKDKYAPVPESLAEALNRQSELEIPEFIKVEKQGKYKKARF